ncbi:MAG: alpha-amylase family glycosyl hydrolase [Bacteroidota bacterium]
MNKIIILLAVALLLLVSCQQNTAEAVDTPKDSATTPSTENTSTGQLPTWARNATIYEVNLRQYAEEKPLQFFTSQLPRLKDMGVDILWFMPIHPISMTNRKATPDMMIEEVTGPEEKKKYLGSPYSVTDYRAFNPEYGTMDDFKKMLKNAHDLDMRVIIDWVPNHTGWDHQWIKDHPDWYTQVDGKIIKSPTLKGEPTDWYDVAELNFDNQEMRKAMIADMKYWITEVGIDGFRMDVAHDVPNDFWTQCSNALFAAGDIFMLAEGQVPEQMNSGNFHADYGWDFHHLMNEIAKGEKVAWRIDEWLGKDRARFKQGFHMMFTSNHDENTWAGTVFDRMGHGHQTFAVLAATFDGMPLCYSGQESANQKRLEFFTKDVIKWGNYEYADFYKKLFELKHQNQALWNGEWGGQPTKIETSNENDLYAFQREKDGDKVVVVLNLSGNNQVFELKGSGYAGEYNNVFTGGKTNLTDGMQMQMKAWDYLVLSNR